ncbi:Ig-like domain-containing protein, partial [Litoreibacter arenae]|uniref:Ig-like domain-containing protein n=1 Tax=Litoreibacter arenae TaxID=491388 RepID=UPI000594AA02
MDYRDISPYFTEDGKLKLLAPELDTLQELVDAGDRGAFHFLYGEMADNDDARLTAKISTFSDTVGGTAFASNWALQQTEPNYPGIYAISQQIAVDILLLARREVEIQDGGTGYLDKEEHFTSADNTWINLGIGELFPGNLVKLARNEADLGFWEELGDIAAFLALGGSPGEQAALWGAAYSGYTGKKLSDFEGVSGYEIIEVAGGQVVVDSEGRTTATFISAGGDDLLAELTQGFTLGLNLDSFIAYPESIYNVMGEVGSQTQILSPWLPEYADARRDFTQFSDGAYNGDNAPLPSVGDPTLRLSQDATGDRDLLMYTDTADVAFAGAGNDLVMMADGNDRAHGQAGDDVLWGQQGSDQLDGGAGNDILRGGIGNDVLYGGEGDDILDGSDITIEGYEAALLTYVFGDERLAALDGHDVLMGGTGDDLLRGGLGADFLFDRGLETYTGDQINLSPSNTLLYAYDGGDDGNGDALGSDILVGGEGSDFLVYSGGRDTFYGGTGDDTYLVSPEFIENREFSFDELTIVLEEEDIADESTWFGHDYVIGNGRGIHSIVFEGLNRDDVTFAYEYEETAFDELSTELQTSFINLLGIDSIDLGTFPIFSLSGQLSITVNATGSSIYFDNVGGAYVGGNNSFYGSVFIEPMLATETYAVFEDGTYFDWMRELDRIEYVQPVNGTISDDADDAPESQAEERGFEPPEEEPEEQIGTNATDFLVGTSADENLVGLQGDDYLHGWDGNDILTGNEGADLIHGGEGFDIANYSTAADAIVVSLSSGNGISGEADGDRLISIEGVRGSAFGDTLYGGAGNNQLFGGDGDDRIESGFGAGVTYMNGGNGADVLIVRSGNAQVLGGAGNDQLFSGPAAGIEFMFGEEGDDTLYASMGDDLYDGGTGYDTLSTEYLISSLSDRYVNLEDGIMRARFFTDNSIGIGSNELVSIEAYLGGRGNDQVFGSSAANLLSGGGGNDELDGGAGDDTLYGSSGDDILRGGDGDDALYGSIPGLSTYLGSDILFGGAGTDTAYYSAAFSTYSFSTFNGVLFVAHGDGNFDEIADDVELIAFADATYTWGELSAIMINDGPTAIDDTVEILEGETVTLDPRLNDSDPNGDPLSIVEVNGNATGPSSTSYTGPGLDLAIRLTANGSLSFEADNFFGDDLAPAETYVLTVTYTVSDGLGGFSSADITVTVVGNDEEVVGAVDGTENSDVINTSYVDADGDTVSSEADTIFGLGGDDTINSGGGDDTVYGGDGDDIIDGGDGDDQLHGGGGNDTLLGLAGADFFDGGEGNDTVSYSYTAADLFIDLSAGGASTGAGAPIQESFASIENVIGSDGENTIIGDFEDNILSGLDGSDRLEGGAGADTLIGGLDADTLVGGTGADVYRFTTGDAADRILDFDPEEDIIEIDGVVFDVSAVPSGVSVSDQGADVLLSYGSGDTIVLEGLSVTEWIAATSGGTTVGILDGTESADIIDTSYVDADGDTVTDGAETIYGFGGDDTISSGSGNDTIYGGAGNDTIQASRGNKTIDGGDGNDTIYVIDSSVVDGGAGDDYLFSNLNKGGDHTFTGGTGADTFEFAYAG